MPNPTTLREYKSLKVFGSWIHHPNLWHLNRYSVSTAFSIGLFWCWVPIPFQMASSGACAILFRANIALAVGLVWLTNPVTMPPMFYFAYRLGASLIDVPSNAFTFELSWEWLANGFLLIWQPFLLGCAILGVISSLLGNIGVRLLWRYSVARHWAERKAQRRRRQRAAQLKR